MAERAEADSAAPGPSRLLWVVARFAARGAAVLRRLIGAPDYERYVSHQRTHHPGSTVLTPREFLAARLAARYDRPGSRCC